MEKRSNFSLEALTPFFHNIFYLLVDFLVIQGPDFLLRDKRLFEISEVEITGVMLYHIYTKIRTDLPA